MTGVQTCALPIYASGVVSFVVSKGTYAYSAVYYDSTKTGSVSVTVSDVVTNISFERDVADSQPVLNGNIQIVIIATSTTFKFKVTSSVADYVIDWGDGETSTATATGTTEYTHVYDEVGYYDIEISNCSNVTMAIPTTIANVVAYWSIGNSNINGLSFYSASKLKTIGSDIFKNDATRISFDSCFDSCPKFTIIPEGLFDSCTAVTNFSSLFRRCSNLTSIPEGLFDKCTAVTDLSWCFGSCFNLTSIPEGLFDKCTSVTSFSACFNSCSNLTSIPEGLFDKCTSVTSFGGAFDSCYNLTSIPEGLFDSCTAATDFSIIFRYCSNLTSIPEGLFDSCTAVTNLSWCFADCTKLTNGIVPNVDTTPNINNMYYNCTVIDFVKVKREIPLSFSNTITGNSTFKVYVPDASVDAYKAASGWSAFATRIFPMSQFSTDFPNG